MNNKPLVSVVIPVYDGSNYLREAIDSALAQTYANVEIVVVNDGSNDNGATRNIAESFGDSIAYYEKPNGGSSSALNLGIEKMTGEWFSWLSHDDLYYPQKIQEQIDALFDIVEYDKQITSHVLFGATDTIDSGGKVILKANAKRAKTIHLELENMRSNCYLVAEGGSKYCFHGCSCLIHKSVFDNIGNFNENLRLLNDLDMWKRIYKAGYHVHYVPSALVMGRMHTKQVSVSIGFSYHNTEQDLYWSDSVEWLLNTALPESDRKKALYLFGCAAYMKTRDAEGRRAFDYLTRAQGGKKWFEWKRRVIVVKRTLRRLGKSMFRKLYFR